jgi:hypothetical protein
MTDRERPQDLRAGMKERKRVLASAPSWRTQTRRRLLALLVVAVVAVMAVWAHVNPSEIGLPLTGLGVVAVLMMAPRVLTRAVAETPRRDLDERDRGLRDAAWRQAYVVTLVVLALFVGYVMVAGGGPDAGDQAMRMGGALVLGCVSAPTLVLAWTLPDDDPADLADQV